MALLAVAGVPAATVGYAYLVELALARAPVRTASRVRPWLWIAPALALLVVSLTPTAAGLAGRVYLPGAVLLGMGFTAVAVWTAAVRNTRAARALFLASLVYLPALCALLMLDAR